MSSPITQLSTELLQKIYEFAAIQDVLHLSITCKKHQNAFMGHRMAILQKAFYNSCYGPYPELMKLVMSGVPDTNRKLVGTETRRRDAVERCIGAENVPRGLGLETMKKMVRYGKLANEWVDLYPQLRWRFESDERRTLQPHEAERLRKAVYQHWTYSNLFHDQDYCEWDPESPGPGMPHRDDLRIRLARTWTTIDMVRQSEFVDKMRQILEIDLFPSNSVIQHRYSRIFPPKELAKYGWGERQEHAHLIDALLKLNPEEILRLYQHTSDKFERLEYLRTKGRWFQIPSSWDAAIKTVASSERSVLGHPIFLSTLCWGLYPYVELEDRNVMYGIIDSHGVHHWYRHLYANDACLEGEWIDPVMRLGFRGRLWLDNDVEEGSDSE